MDFCKHDNKFCPLDNILQMGSLRMNKEEADFSVKLSLLSQLKNQQDGTQGNPTDAPSLAGFSPSPPGFHHLRGEAIKVPLLVAPTV